MASRLNFPTVAVLLLGVFSFMQIAEAYRFPEVMKIWFVSLKLLFGFICLMIAILFYLRPFRDLYAAIFYVVGIAYSITFSWFAPLYEIAFLQIALGSAFFPVTRKWLFPVIFGIGLMGHLLTYYLQNLWGWQIAQPYQTDWIQIVVIFFVLSWLIHQFVLNRLREQHEQEKRFLLIGQASSRILHDVKGLLSGPILLIDSIKQNTKPVVLEDLDKILQNLSSDLVGIRDHIRSINRLVLVSKK